MKALKPLPALRATTRRDELTFRANLRHTRYGWLRLTPAYSVHLVREILEREPLGGPVLDPFCGTGTTALVCAERGISAETTDINPFLLWLTAAKTRPYSERELRRFDAGAEQVALAAGSGRSPAAFVPKLHQIEKWWSRPVLSALSRAFAEILRLERDGETPHVVDLLKVAFCQTLIGSANVSFAHQSMSFKRQGAARERRSAEQLVAEPWRIAARAIALGAASIIERVPVTVECDARELGARLAPRQYACVITSPPYPNRMSYIRELRPYMYWLGYLAEGHKAGALDWLAIGGTWGSATSRVGKWSAPHGASVPYAQLAEIVERIAAKSHVLARYVEKYFFDMDLHCRSLFPLVRAGGSVHYIVGNSKFYDVLLPVERILLALLEAAGFTHASVTTIRKRSSKKELFEFVVSARKPD